MEAVAKASDFRIMLDRRDVLGLGTFLALGDREFDLLAFGQSAEAGAVDSAEMREYVGSGFLLDETKSLGFVKPFYFAGRLVRHVFVPFEKNKKLP